jgi:AcrR family transcriptional regulator
MTNPRSPISRRQLQKEDTRRVILEAAYSLFAEEGYARTTMRALARRAGIGLGTIFKHFPDKPSLLVAAFQEDLGLVIQEAFKTLPKRGIKGQLLHLTEKIYCFYANNPGFSRTLVKEGFFLEGEYGRILDEQLMNFLQDVSELIGLAVNRGELASGTNPAQGAMAFGSFYLSGLIMGLKQPVFAVDGQIALVAGLIDNFFPFSGERDHPIP